MLSKSQGGRKNFYGVKRNGGGDNWESSIDKEGFEVNKVCLGLLMFASVFLYRVQRHASQHYALFLPATNTSYSLPHAVECRNS